jgi:hypothetical protein
MKNKAKKALMPKYVKDVTYYGDDNKISYAVGTINRKRSLLKFAKSVELWVVMSYEFGEKITAKDVEIGSKIK